MDIKTRSDATKNSIVYSEYLEQRAYFEWLSQVYPLVYALTFHIPNGGKRSKSEAVRFKYMGVKPGVPDIFMPVANENYHGLFIELKPAKINGKSAGKVSEKQTLWLEALISQGYWAQVCYGWIEAADLTREYLTK